MLLGHQRVTCSLCWASQSREASAGLVTLSNAVQTPCPWAPPHAQRWEAQACGGLARQEPSAEAWGPPPTLPRSVPQRGPAAGTSHTPWSPEGRALNDRVHQEQNAAKAFKTGC